MDSAAPSSTLRPLLHALVGHGGSDLHVRAGAVPRLRIDGALRRLTYREVSHDECKTMATEYMPERCRTDFDANREADFAFSVPGLGRFRVNVFLSTGLWSLVVRAVAPRPSTVDELGLPGVIRSLARHHDGLVLITGQTGSGKSTTAGAMIDLINAEEYVHILTLEDPIEVLHASQRAMVSQREIRTDSANIETALEAAMREDPNVIFLGETRSAATARSALMAAESGHLVLTTLHASGSTDAISRFLDFFPPAEQDAAARNLGRTVRGVVCQRLIPHLSGKGRVAALEILVGTQRAAAAIAARETHNLDEIITESKYDEMQTFDEHLVDLVKNGQISVEAAKRAASNVSDLSIELSGLSHHEQDLETPRG